MRELTRRLIAVVITCAPFAAQATPILQIDDAGILTGATGVVVGGAEYDVYFTDGNCIGLFDGCDEPDDFTFTTVEAATAAANALLDQLLVGQFDTTPSLVYGCLTTSWSCAILTPWSVSGYAWTAAAYNYSDETPLADWVNPNNNLFTYWRTDRFGSTYTYAIWSPAASAAPVPEPSSLALWLSALIGLRLIGSDLRSR